jgi:hypothetical protein
MDDADKWKRVRELQDQANQKELERRKKLQEANEAAARKLSELAAGIRAKEQELVSAQVMPWETPLRIHPHGVGPNAIPMLVWANQQLMLSGLGYGKDLKRLVDLPSAEILAEVLTNWGRYADAVEERFKQLGG